MIIQFLLITKILLRFKKFKTFKKFKHPQNLKLMFFPSNKKHGITGPLSQEQPKPNEIENTKSLESFLHAKDPSETEEEAIIRERVLGRLSFMFDTLIKNVAEKKNVNKDFDRNSSCRGKIYTFGSYRLGVHGRNADIDTLCVAPVYVDKKEFFEDFYFMLKEVFFEVEKVEAAYVPLMQLVWREKIKGSNVVSKNNNIAGEESETKNVLSKEKNVNDADYVVSKESGNRLNGHINKTNNFNKNFNTEHLNGANFDKDVNLKEENSKRIKINGNECFNKIENVNTNDLNGNELFNRENLNKIVNSHKTESSKTCSSNTGDSNINNSNTGSLKTDNLNTIDSNTGGNLNTNNSNTDNPKTNNPNTVNPKTNNPNTDNLKTNNPNTDNSNPNTSNSSDLKADSLNKVVEIKIDLVFASLNLFKIDNSLNLLDSSLLKNLDEKSVMSLNGNRVADELLELVPNIKTFHGSLRCIKYWAKRRGLIGYAYGYFGGVAYAITVARICQLFPNACSFTIVLKYFEFFKDWK